MFTARIALCLRTYDRISEGSRSLKWLNVSEKFLFKDLVLVFKCLNGLVRIRLSFGLSFRLSILQNGRRFIAETGEDSKTWALHDAACHLTGQRSFYFWAAKQWNSLLNDLQGIRNIKNFKKILFNIILNEWNRHHWLFVFLLLL